MVEPLISIVTPTYNRANYIENTITSVLEQSYKNVEYIVMDGCSTDNTTEIVEKYKKIDGRVFYASEKDEGMYDAINKGFSVAKGDILAYINSDDLYTPEVFKAVVDYFSNHPEIDVVYGDTMVVETGVGVHINIYMPFLKAWLRAGGIIAQPTVFMRRRCWEKVGDLRKEVKYLGDCEYWLRLLANGFCFGKINEVLAVEYNHGDTLRNTMQDEIESEKDFLRKKYWTQPPLSEGVRWAVLFSRKLLTPVWYMFFIIKINMKNDRGAWGGFIRYYKPTACFRCYILNKIFRFKLKIWDVPSHEGNKE